MMVLLRGKKGGLDAALENISDVEINAFAKTLNQIMSKNNLWKEGNADGNP